MFVLIVSCQPKRPVAKNGALHIEDGKIQNQYNKEPQLRGLGFSWSLWGGREFYNPGVTDWIVNDIKVSIVRVAMAVQPQHGYFDEPDLSAS